MAAIVADHEAPRTPDELKTCMARQWDYGDRLRKRFASAVPERTYCLEEDRLTWLGNDRGCRVSGELERAIVREMAQTDARPLNDVRKAVELGMLDDNGYFVAQIRLNRKLAEHSAPFHFHVREGILEVVPRPYRPRRTSSTDGRRKPPRKSPRRQ
jgi:hypothetical protein